MKMKKRNIRKAVLFVVIGFILAFASGFAAILMWFSGKFLPVYIAGKYVLGNQVLRYELYIILAIVFFAGVATADKGLDYLIKRFKRRFGR